MLTDAGAVRASAGSGEASSIKYAAETLPEFEFSYFSVCVFVLGFIVGFCIRMCISKNQLAVGMCRPSNMRRHYRVLVFVFDFADFPYMYLYLYLYLYFYWILC